MRIRGILKAFPLGVVLPMTIGAASIGPKDAGSNLSQWAHLIGISDVPSWLAVKTADHEIIFAAILLSVVYTVSMWGIPFCYRIASRFTALKQLPQENNLSLTASSVRTREVISPTTWENDIVLSNLDTYHLREYTKSLAGAIRKFSANYIQNNVEYDHERITQFLTDYMSRFGVKTNMLYEELLRRNGIYKRPNTSIQNMSLQQIEHPGNPTTILAGANTLEKLVEKLRV